MTASLTPLDCSPMYFGDWWISPSPLSNSIPCFWDSSIPYPFSDRVRVPLNLSALSLGFWDLLAPLILIPWFWDCSIPQPLWAPSLSPFWALSLGFGIVQSLCPHSHFHGFGIVQSFYPLDSILWPLQSQCLEIEGTKGLRLLSPFHFLSSIPQLWNCRDQILLLAHICSYNIQPRPASLIEADSSIEFALLIKHSWPPDSGKFMGCGDSQAGKQEYLCLFSSSSSLLFPVVFSGMRTCAVQWGK